MSKYAIAEPCCGSAALSLYLLGAKASILPYQGGKWSLRKKIEALLVKRGFTDLQAVHLNDSGPWGRTLYALSKPSISVKVIEILEGFSKLDPREKYDELQGSDTPDIDDALFAAEHLFLQRISVNGKAVGLKANPFGYTWKSPGFNKGSAYGVAATKKCSAFRPMVPYLVERVSALQELEWPKGPHTWVSNNDVSATNFLLFLEMGFPLVIYLDPPYLGTTPYPNGSFSRSRVIEFAVYWYDRGATVMISEAEEIEELSVSGWETHVLKSPPENATPFRSKKQEVLMISPRETDDL